MLPPIAKPAAARSRLTPRSFSSEPDKVSFHAVRSTFEGAGSTCGDSQPACANASQTTIRITGAIQDRTIRFGFRPGLAMAEALRAGAGVAGARYSC